MAAMIRLPLSDSLFLLCMTVIFRLIDFSDDLTYCLIYLSVRQYFFCRINEENICAGSGQIVFLLPPAFADPAFEKIPLYGSLEQFLRH